MHECVLGCAVIVFVKWTFGDTWNWDMKAWGAIKVTDISVLGVTHGLCALPRASLLLANLHLVTALSWPVDAFAMCCVWLVQVGCIPHICQFWCTTTICMPEKEHQKCVNLRQNAQDWPEWAKILCSPSKKSTPAWTKYTTAGAVVLTNKSFGRMIWLQCACSSSNFPKTFSSFLWSLNMKQNSWWEIKQRWIIFIEYHTTWSSHHQFSTSWIL